MDKKRKSEETNKMLQKPKRIRPIVRETLTSIYRKALANPLLIKNNKFALSDNKTINMPPAVSKSSISLSSGSRTCRNTTETHRDSRSKLRGDKTETKRRRSISSKYREQRNTEIVKITKKIKTDTQPKPNSRSKLKADEPPKKRRSLSAEYRKIHHNENKRRSKSSDKFVGILTPLQEVTFMNLTETFSPPCKSTPFTLLRKVLK